MHPLKIMSIGAWSCLLLCQLGLLWPALGIAVYWPLALAAILLIPARGLFADRRYTYKWIGFLMMIYFCIGISELVSNPELRWYGFGTTITSLALFLASIYYARYLGLKQRD